MGHPSLYCVLQFGPPAPGPAEEVRQELLSARNALAAAQQEIQVLSACMSLARTAALTSDLETLTGRAQAVLEANIPNLLATFHRREGGRWVAQVTTEGVPADLLELTQHHWPATRASRRAEAP